MAYRCRAYPDQTQQQVLARTFGCVRVVWNRTLWAPVYHSADAQEGPAAFRDKRPPVWTGR